MLGLSGRTGGGLFQKELWPLSQKPLGPELWAQLSGQQHLLKGLVPFCKFLSCYCLCSTNRLASGTLPVIGYLKQIFPRSTAKLPLFSEAHSFISWCSFPLHLSGVRLAGFFRENPEILHLFKYAEECHRRLCCRIRRGKEMGRPMGNAEHVFQKQALEPRPK